MANVAREVVPAFFKGLFTVNPDGRDRWHDNYFEGDSIIIDPKTCSETFRREKAQRNLAYKAWIMSKGEYDEQGNYAPKLKQKKMSFQVVQVLTDKRTDANKSDWWEPFQDCLFRVFTEPETYYDEKTTEYKQWYLLSPEDCFEVARYEQAKAGKTFPPRDYLVKEKYISKHPALRQAYLVPVECCRHWRHETTAGELPDGL